MKLYELVVGKTVVDVQYLEHAVVQFNFDDGTVLEIIQTQQAGALNVGYDGEEVKSDDYEEIYE